MKTISVFLILFQLSLVALAADFEYNYALKAWQSLKKPIYVPKPDANTKETAKKHLLSAGLLFVENNGQVADAGGKLHPEILFTAKAAGAQVYVTSSSIQYVFSKVERTYKTENNGRLGGLDSIKSISTHRFTLELIGASVNPAVVKQEANPYYENYYLAHCPEGVVAHSYEKFTVKGVYPGIDWVVYSNGQGLKYDFVLSRGADLSKIKLRVKDAMASLNKEGDLVMKTTLGEVIEDKPVSFQNGRKLETSFLDSGNQNFGFAVSNTKPDEPLTVDPSVAWATYYGGNDSEGAYSCSIDQAGNVYLDGETNTISLPMAGAFQGVNAGNFDAFLVKFNSSGYPIWATYYGGNENDNGKYCATDVNGNIYLVGRTSSSNLPVFAAFQDTHAGYSDAFLAKFNSSGMRVWATYFGGMGDDGGISCAVDNANNIYLTGFTWSTNLPISGSFQANNSGLIDAFIAKFSSTGSRLWATYYGGRQNESGHSCTTDADGNVYMVGETRSINFPVLGAFQSSFAGTIDAFVVKFNPAGTRLWATLYGGIASDIAHSCTTDALGNIYLSGFTNSTDFPVLRAVQGSRLGSADAFLIKFSSSGSRLWATYYGGNGFDGGDGCTTDIDGNVYMTGSAWSIDLYLVEPYQRTKAESRDAFLVKFNDSGSILWATYYGGNGYDHGRTCRLDSVGNIYLVGYTFSSNLPATSAFPSVYSGEHDLFLVKFQTASTTSLSGTVFNTTLTLHPNPATSQLHLSLSHGQLRQVVVLDQLGRAVLTAQDLQNNILDISALASGTYMVKVITTDGVAFKKLIKE